MSKKIDTEALNASGLKSMRTMFKDMQVTNVEVNGSVVASIAWKYYNTKCVAVLRMDWHTTEGSASGAGYDRQSSSLKNAATRMATVLRGSKSRDSADIDLLISVADGLSKIDGSTRWYNHLAHIDGFRFDDVFVS